MLKHLQDTLPTSEQLTKCVHHIKDIWACQPCSNHPMPAHNSSVLCTVATLQAWNTAKTCSGITLHCHRHQQQPSMID